MRYKYIENADIDVSALSAGTWGVGGDRWGASADPSGSVDAIRAMIDGGVNIIDTSPAYGEGVSEQIVGEALQDGYRNKVLLATKFSRITGEGNTIIHDGSYENAIRECEASLLRMKTDCIDIFIQHWPAPDYPIEETMGALVDLKKAGKIRFVGVSNFDQDLIEQASKAISIDFLQHHYSMLNETNTKLFEWCKLQGIGVMTYGSLGGGILTGAVRNIPEWDKTDFRLSFYGKFYREPVFSRIMSLLDVLDEISIERGKPVSQISINWTTQKPFVSTAICGVRSVANAAQNCAAFDWELSEEEVCRIDEKLKEIDLQEA